MPTTRHFKLRVLGGLTLERSGLEPAPVSISKGSLSILALLSVSSSGMSRDKLVAYRWPESDSEAARNSLDQAFYVLRRTLGPDFLLADARDPALNPAVVSSDLHAFETARARADHEAAVDLYGGPFLDGFHLRNAGEFERWVDSERARIAREFATSLERLAAVAEERSDWHGAAERWRQLAVHDPFSSRIALAVIRSLANAGDPGSALRYARDHEHFVLRELDLDSVPAVASLAAELRRTNGGADIAAGQAMSSNALSAQWRVPSGEPSATGDDLSHAHSPPTQQADAPVETPAPDPPRRRVSMRVIAAGGSLALVSISLAIAWAKSSSAPLDARRVAVRFEAASESRYTSALASDLTTRIVDGLRSVEIDATPVSADESRSAINRIFGRSRQARLRASARSASAAILIAGDFRTGDDSIRLQADLIDAATGRVIRHLSTIGGPARDGEVTVSTFSERIKVAVATHLEPRLTLWGSLASQPAAFATYQEYVRGIDHFFNDKYEAARTNFLAAAAQDSDFTAPLIWVLFIQTRLKYAVMPLGELPAADSLARGLTQRRRTLWPWDRLMLDERMAILRGDRESAYRSMRELSDLSPNSEWNFLLARHALYSNRPKLAIAALAKLDPESGWIKGMGSYWAVLLDAQHRAGDYESELSTVRRARERYLNLPWDLSVRYPRALVASGRVAEARLFMDSIAAKATQPKSEFMFRGLLMHLTGEARAHGQPLLARDWAVADSVSHPIAPFVAGMEAPEALRALHILHRREQWEQARLYASYLVRLDPGNHEYHMLLGAVAGRLGDRDEALRHSQWFLTAPRIWGSHHHSRAVIAAALGDSSEAVRLLKEAFADGYLFDTIVHWAFAPLRDYPPFQALLRPAG